MGGWTSSSLILIKVLTKVKPQMVKTAPGSVLDLTHFERLDEPRH